MHGRSHRDPQCGGVNILDSVAGQFKNFRNNECDPAKEIVPWGFALSKNKGISKWNKLVKPSAQGFKPFREANNWVDCKDRFMIALKAQNLAYLVDPSHTIVAPDLHKAQQKHLHKVMRDALLHHEAKLIIKFYSKIKYTCVIWQKTCKTCDESIFTSVNGDAVPGWLTGTRLNASNWNRPEGECVTF